MDKRRIVVSSIGGFAGVALSPDGSKVAIYLKTRLEIHDVSSLKVDASVALPVYAVAGDLFRWADAFGAPNYFPTNNSRVRYCDHGKYIVIYGDHGTFYVIDAIDYRRAATITLDPPDAKTGYEDIAFSCAAGSNIVAVEVRTTLHSIGAYGISMMDGTIATIKVFAVDSGKQTGEITQAISQRSSSTESWGRLEVSPSGSRALIYLTDMDNGDMKEQKVAVLDIGSFTVSNLIDAGFRIGQASFVGDSSIAVAGAGFSGADAHPVLKIFDAQTGALEKQISDSRDAPHELVEASADGRFLMAYTGKENYCEACSGGSRGELQISHGQFTVWDLTTGRIIAKSPGISAPIEDGRNPFPWREYGGRSNTRPRFQFSQSGNAVLVTGTHDEFAVDVYLLP